MDLKSILDLIENLAKIAGVLKLLYEGVKLLRKKQNVGPRVSTPIEEQSTGSTPALPIALRDWSVGRGYSTENLISFLTARRLVGVLSIGVLTIILFYAYVVSDCIGVERSISMYYHTGLRDVFVAMFCAIGVLMLMTKGHDRTEMIAHSIAGVSAICFALFPTSGTPCCGSY